MNASEYFRSGQLNLAMEALNEELRLNPLDSKRRTFLFELLCLTGDFDRSLKHLDVLAQQGQQAEMGAMLYRSAVLAERSRQDFFRNQEYSLQRPASDELPGALNGRPFQTIADADARIGAHLEVFVAGRYIWIPFAHIASISMQAPRRVRDLQWSPAIVRTTPDFAVQDLGEVLLPALYPFTHTYTDDAVRLGRATKWDEAPDGGEIPFGQKLLLVDGDEVPFLEMRELAVHVAKAVAG